MISFEYATNKDGLRALRRLKGFGNGDKLSLGGHEFLAGSLIYECFVAEFNPVTKLFEGELRFAEEESMEACRKPMSALLAEHSKGVIGPPLRDPPAAAEQLADVECEPEIAGADEIGNIPRTLEEQTNV